MSRSQTVVALIDDDAALQSHPRKPVMSRMVPMLRKVLAAMGWLFFCAMLLWVFGALWYDFPSVTFRNVVAVAFLAGSVAAFIFLGFTRLALIGVGAAILVTLGWWFTLSPDNDRDWQADVAKTAWAEIDGDVVTLHNVRNCDYRKENDYTVRWETRTLHLSKLTGVDIAIDYWGSDLMAHPMLSFQFSDSLPVAFSIETRKEKGESYSAIGGLYRQFELIYIAADERDVFRVRTNYRKGEDLYLYHTTLSAEDARIRFGEYVTSLNKMRNTPRWYNALTTNCTTAIRSQHPGDKRTAWDWRMLVNGKMDRLLYETGVISDAGLSFPELRKQALVNKAAQAADRSPDFSKLIREGRPGFDR